MVEAFMAYGNLLAGLVFMGLLIAKQRLTSDMSSFLHAVDWRIFMLWIVLAYVVAPYFFYKLLAVPSQATYLVVVLTGIYPLFTALLGYAFFKESIAWTHVMGVVCIVAGLVLLQL